MNSQTTPVHMRLWHHEFWLLVIAALLLTMSVYMLIPTLPEWLLATRHFTPQQTGLAVAAYGLGLYLFGAQCSWLVQHYRRNVVCMWAIVAQAVSVLMLGYFSHVASFPLVLLQRFSLGAAFGLAQMVLMSTLVIDTCESHQRTEANFGAAWFSRFGLSLGPLTGLALTALYPVLSSRLQASVHLSLFAFLCLASGAMSLVSMLLIRRVTFPFRSPEEGVSMVSLDRFFLPSGFPLFVNLLMISTVVGMMLSLRLSLVFYALMMGGFLLALLAQRFVFRDAELQSEVISGLILLAASQLVLLTSPLNPLAPLLAGMAVGIVSSRFLLFFVKLSRHCQRGTSQSTYFLSWESGLTLGIAVGYGCFADASDLLLYAGLAVTALSLLMYYFFTHRWFVNHKNR